MNSCRSTWEDLQDVHTVFLPVGSMEQHGPHLPVGTDGMIAEALARRLAEAIPGAYVLPLLPFSCSYEHAGFPGTVSLRATTLAAVISDLTESLAHSGIHRLILVNGHGGNHVLRNVVQEVNALGRVTVWLVPGRDAWSKAYAAAGLTSTPSADMHAGEAETSLLLYLVPEAVRVDRIRDVEQPERPLLETVGMKAYSASGTIGYPSRATPEKGRGLLDALVSAVLPLLDLYPDRWLAPGHSGILPVKRDG